MMLVGLTDFVYQSRYLYELTKLGARGGSKLPSYESYTVYIRSKLIYVSIIDVEIP